MLEKPIACESGVIENLGRRDDVEAVCLGKSIEPVGHCNLCALVGRHLVTPGASAIEDASRNWVSTSDFSEGARQDIRVLYRAYSGISPVTFNSIGVRSSWKT